MPLVRKVDPPRTNAKIHIDQAWHRLMEAINEGAASFENILWVDQTSGNDGTAVRGSLVLKFSTIQGALDAALAGDTVWASPGLYVEDIDWPDTDLISLRGMGPLSTVLINATARDTVRIVPTVVLAGVEISDMVIANDGADRSLDIDGSADTAMFAGRVLSLHDLNLTNNVRIEGANEITFINILAKDADLLLLNTSRSTMLECQWDNITVTYENAPAVPPVNGINPLVATSTIVRNVLTVNNLGRVAFGADTQVNSVVGALTDVVAGNAGTIWMAGHVVGAVTIGFTYDDTYHECCRFDYARIGGVVTVEDTAGTQRGLAKFRHAELLDTTGPHTSGNLCDMDLRGALFAQASLDVDGDGTVDRSVWQFQGATGEGAADYAEVIFGGTGAPPGAAIPYPPGNNYQVFVESTVLADLPVKIDTKAAASFHRTKTADGLPCLYTIIRPFD